MPIPRTLLDSPLTDLDLELRSGAWPQGLGGEVFISTSERATAPVHGFFGDGVMIRLSLAAGTHGAAPEHFAWRHRVLDTPTRRLREAQPDVWQANGLGWSSPFGYANSANTAPLPWDGRLFATWDAGRPVEIDPVSLRFLGEVGQRDSWGDDLFGHPVLPMVNSTAHPVVDPERNCLWSVRADPATGGAAKISQNIISSRNCSSVRVGSGFATSITSPSSTKPSPVRSAFVFTWAGA